MYTDIFREIVEIMHNDYAGFIDKEGWDNPDEFMEKIQELEKSNTLTPNSFADIVHDYILDFQDPHIIFNLIQSKTQHEMDNGFRTRRYEDTLYVTSRTTENRLNIGDALISLDGIPISTLVEKHQRELMETKAEREDWRYIISKYHTAEVIDTSENKRILEFKKYEKAPYQAEHYLKNVTDDTYYMKVTDFFSAEPIDQLVAQNKDILDHISTLILDVRYNLGGSTDAYKSLEKYLFPEGNNTIDFSFYDMQYNYTERNVALMVEAIDEELKKIENKQQREGLVEWKEQTWEKHRGKGLIRMDKGDKGNTYGVKGHTHPKRVIVLTDNYCGSAGDMFVYTCKQSPKVTVVGRPTMGINDYSNLTVKQWNNQFEFMYPTTRLTQIDTRKPDAEQGIKPDIYVPWTPKHIQKDVDMEVVRKVLAGEKVN